MIQYLSRVLRKIAIDISPVSLKASLESIVPPLSKVCVNCLYQLTVYLNSTLFIYIHNLESRSALIWPARCQPKKPQVSARLLPHHQPPTSSSRWSRTIRWKWSSELVQLSFWSSSSPLPLQRHQLILKFWPRRCVYITNLNKKR